MDKASWTMQKMLVQLAWEGSHADLERAGRPEKEVATSADIAGATR
jgi:hypothetical protein